MSSDLPGQRNQIADIAIGQPSISEWDRTIPHSTKLPARFSATHVAERYRRWNSGIFVAEALPGVGTRIMTFTRLKLPRLQGSRSSPFSPARAVSVVAVVAHKVLVLVGDIDEQKVQPLQLRLDLVVAI